MNKYFYVGFFAVLLQISCTHSSNESKDEGLGSVESKSIVGLNSDYPLETLKNNECYYIQSSDGQFLKTIDRQLVLSHDDSQSLFCVSFSRDHKVHIQDFHSKQYISAEQDGSVSIKPDISGWETFDLETSKGQLYLKSVHHTFLTADIDKSRLKLTREEPHQSNYLRIVKPILPVVHHFKNGECYFVQNLSGKFLTDDHSKLEFSDHSNIKSLFCISFTRDRQVVIRGQWSKKYLSARDGLSITLQDQVEGNGEKFDPQDTAQGISLMISRSSSPRERPRFLAVTSDGQTLTQLNDTQNYKRRFIFFRNAHLNEEYQLPFRHAGTAEATLQNSEVPHDEDKRVWTFWDKGIEHMPLFYQLNVEHWRRVLGASWKIHVVSLVPTDENYVFNWISKSDLPATFELLNPVVKSDAVRIALLDKYGGVWMDSSNILLRSLDEICWDSLIRDNVVQCLYYGEGYGSDSLGRRDYIENWFIATRKNNKFISLWHEIFNLYWDDRIESTSIGTHPLYSGIELENFVRFGNDFRNYLTQHVAVRSLIEKEPKMRKIFENNTKLINSERAFKIMSQVGWSADAIYDKLLGTPKDNRFVEVLFNESDLLKFTSGSANGMRRSDVDRSVLLDEDKTLGAIFRRIRDTYPE